MEPRLGALARTLIALVLFAGDAAADPLPPPSPEASAQMTEGMKAFEAKDYERAITAFETAYRLEPRPEFLFALAQAERLSGDCPTALVLYQRFLETQPAEKHAEIARTSIARCQQALASRPLDAKAPEPEAAAPAPAPAPLAAPTPTPPRRSRFRDPLGGVLLGVGVAGLAAGGVTFAMSRSAATEADGADTYDGYASKMDRAERLRLWSLIGFGGGGALVAAAALRYATLDTGGAIATVSVESGGARAVLSGSF
jgi:hypothetical protein